MMVFLKVVLHNIHLLKYDLDLTVLLHLLPVPEHLVFSQTKPLQLHLPIKIYLKPLLIKLHFQLKRNVFQEILMQILSLIIWI